MDTPLAFRAHLISMGCPESLLDSIERKNRANAASIAARKAVKTYERRAASAYVKDYYARLEQDTAQRRAGIVPEEVDRDRDARRRRMMLELL